MSLDLVSVLIGGGIATATSVLLHFLNRAHQDAIQQNEIATRLAIEMAKIDHETQKFMQSRKPGSDTSMRDPPMDRFVYQMLDFTSALHRHRRMQRWQRIKDWLGCCW
jgi:hypothetical protein